MKLEMGHSLMDQFDSFVDGVIHLEEVVSVVSYPVLLIPILLKSSMQISVSITIFSVLTSK